MSFWPPWKRGPQLPPAPPLRPEIGVVCNDITTDDIISLELLHVRHARITLYPNTEEEAFRRDLQALDAAHITPLIVFNWANIELDHMIEDAGRLAQAFRGRTWQILNEPDADMPAVRYGACLRDVATAMRRADPSAKVYTAGFSNSASLDYIRIALFAGANFADALCVHAYAPDNIPLVNAIHDRVELVRRLGWERKVVLSEFGHNSKYPDDLDYVAALKAIPSSWTAYYYALRCNPAHEADKGLLSFDTRAARPIHSTTREFIQGKI